MDWFELTENPKAITSLFERPPSLEAVEVMRIKIDRDGPTIELTLGLNEYPTSKPARWKQSDANAATLNLQLVGVTSIEHVGWSTTNNAAVNMQRIDSGLEVTAIGLTLRLRCHCSHARIAGISAYHREQGT